MKQLICAIAVRAISVLLFALVFLPLRSTHATVISTILPFTTSNQSMWAPGPATTIPPIDEFFGVKWNVGGSFGGILEAMSPKVQLTPEFCTPFFCIPPLTIPAIDFGDYGAEFDASTKGTVGLDFGVEFDSGSVNVTYPIRALLDIPDPFTLEVGETFPINTSFEILPNALLTTDFPNGRAKLDFLFELEAKLGAEVCIIDCLSETFVDVNVDKSFNILDISSKEQQTLEIFGGLSEITAKFPDIDTVGSLDGNQLKSTGEDSLIDLEVDVDKIATTFLGLPPLGANLDAAGLSLAFEILDIGVGAEAKRNLSTILRH